MTDSPIVLRHIVVDAPVEKAFATFTERFDEVKPRAHNLMDAPIAETVFEPHVGGRIYDRAEDGQTCTFARVLAFEPPIRVVFSWDLGVNMQLETDPANASEVEVRFTPEGAGRTRVEIEHRHLDRHGPGWPSARDGLASDQGWPLYLQRYAALLPEVTHTQ